MRDLCQAHDVLLFININVTVNAINIFIINPVVAFPSYIYIFPLFSMHKGNGENYTLLIQ
jgi:hypothetical protein